MFEGRKPKARELLTIAVLCAIGIAGRGLFFMMPQFKPVLALTIIAGVAFGGEVGFLVGAMTMLTSNMIFGQGPWTPWQMFAMGIIGFLAGILFKKGWLCRTRGTLAVFGAFATVLIYGGIMNPASLLIVSGESLTWETILAAYMTGLPMDIIHAFGTVIFLWIAAEPMLEKMDRIKTKYGIAE
jgi:energy-coupling factor transport system ATP-binding protein